MIVQALADHIYDGDENEQERKDRGIGDRRKIDVLIYADMKQIWLKRNAMPPITKKCPPFPRRRTSPAQLKKKAARTYWFGSGTAK